MAYMFRTKKEFEKWFRQECLPGIRQKFELDGRVDYIARRTDWINLVDMMVTNKELPKRALEWDPPW